MGYVEYQEHKIKEIYSLFITVCKEIRSDSYKTRTYGKDQLEFFVKLYEQFKKLVPFMMAKNSVLNLDGSQMESIEDIMNLPHMEKLKADLIAKAL